MESKENKRINLGFKIFIILLIGIILLFSKKENQEKFIDFIQVVKSSSIDLKVIESFPIESNIDNIAFYNKGIMIWKDKKLTRLSLKGSKEWEKEFILDEPHAVFGEKGIYIYEKSTGDIYFLDSSGETEEKIELNTSINNIVEGFENIIVHNQKTNMESLNILDKKGNIIVNNLIDDKNILTYCINENSTEYALSALNLNEENIKSELQVFNLDGKISSTSQFDNEIILYSNYIEDDKILVMSDKSLYVYNKGNILWQKEFQLIKDIYVNKEKINILYGNTLEILSFDGMMEEKYSFAEEYKKIIAFDKYITLYGEEYIIGLRDGKEIFKYKSEDPILKVVEGSQNLIVVYEDRIDLVKR